MGLGPTALVHFDHDVAASEKLALHIDLVRGGDGGGGRGRDWGGVRVRVRVRGRGRGRGRGKG